MPYYVYIMASDARCLYVGCTSNLERRVAQHRLGVFRGFTARYRVTKLVHYEETGDVRVAINRERALKGWVRRRKVALIEATNPAWRDLAQDWGLPPVG